MSPLSVRLALLLALALAFAAPSPASAAEPGARTARTCPAQQVAPSARSLPAVRTAVLCLLNRERAARGLRALKSDARLRRAARRHSADMARRGYFAHTSPTGSTMTRRVLRAGYARGAAAWTIGENLAWGAGSRATATSIVRAWMASPGHRANILQGRFRHIGVGIAAPGPRVLFTTDFGARR